MNFRKGIMKIHTTIKKSPPGLLAFLPGRELAYKKY
jgi:hypothetical protein